ncbi:type I-E CRISPR-associated protein Cse1/CasA [Nocardiopsis sp. SBT366]|uniref:type I-E CRISPR-associated protein Cse1/CasA n=1 Tax=Nocardiopsis sp. SBT366 TaxID=1580529 RepID=UPI00066E90DF|nr:type I-E CRISPR-associated protein Cse1/CasA [Nocardiopsis sp. SBT366]
MRFDLLREPWIPVVTLKGEPETVGLQEALDRAHEFRWLQGETPTVTAALHRLLVTLTFRVYFDGIESAGWRTRWSELWHRGPFPTERLDRYLNGEGDSPGYRDRFDLFGDRPFFQTPDIPEELLGSTAKLTMFRAAGNNATLFDHSTQEDQVELSPAEAARWLVTVQAFDTGGLKTGKLPSQPSLGNSSATVLIEGSTLRETLLLNTTPNWGDDTLDPRPGPGDRPVWERDPTDSQGSQEADKRGRAPYGLLDLLTWPSRHVRLRGRVGANGVVIDGVAILPGPRLSTDLRLVENMAAYRRTFTKKKNVPGKGVASPWKPVQLEELRGVWRHCRELLLADEDNDSQRERFRPRNLDHVAERHQGRDALPGSTVYTIRVLGQQLDPNRGAVHTWLEEVVPAPAAVLRARPQETRLEPLMGLAVSLADDVGDELGKLEREYHALLRDTPRAERKLLQQWFWPRLSEHFNDYLVDLGEKIKEDHEGAFGPTENWANVVEETAEEAQHRWVEILPRRSARNLLALAECTSGFQERVRGIRHEFDRNLRSYDPRPRTEDE